MKRAYRIHDLQKSQSKDLTNFGVRNQRFAIVEKATLSIVDYASSRYEARQAVKMWNAGILTK